MTSTPRSRPPVKGAKASPEVRSALAALKARQRPQPSRQSSSASTIKQHDDLDDLGLPSIRQVVEKSRSTEYHPSNKAPPSFNLVDLSISDRDDDSTRWYEAKELTVLKVSSNELESVDEALSGFTLLESLDLSSNLITSLPLQFAQLGNLTSLKLAKNRFESIPLQLLALNSLTELDLSENSIGSLWPTDWRDPLKELLTPEDEVSPNASANSDFWSAFPSSPTKPRPSTAPQTASPFPFLRTLNLSHNRLKTEALAQDGFTLPESLQRIDLSSNLLASPLPLPIFTPCRHLIVLELQNNELAEPVFCERDPLQDAFPALRELDLSINAIDDLSALESLLAHRSAQWLGLPKTVPQRAPLTAAGGLRAKLTGNPLRNEAARRRAAKTAALSKPTPVRTVQAVTPTSPLSAMRSMSIEEVKPVSSDAEDVVEAHEQTVNGRATADEAQSVLAGAMDAAGAVSLVGRGLNELPMDLATTATTISSIDASRNALTVLPLGELAACTWSSTLRRLSFSRNRIAALTLSSASVQLPSLVELDLSSNRLSDSDLLHGIATTCPALENLDLTFNSLTALTGVAALLMPSRGRGLRSLKLGSNQLADLSALIEVALRVRGAEGGAWACDELDLRDNAIAKLPPELGLLPLQFLGVSGNLFRVPQRKVYEDGGSTSNLLKWLKDRL